MDTQTQEERTAHRERIAHDAVRETLATCAWDHNTKQTSITQEDVASLTGDVSQVLFALVPETPDDAIADFAKQLTQGELSIRIKANTLAKATLR